MAKAKRPSPFPSDPSFGNLASRVEAEIEHLHEVMRRAEEFEREISAREDTSLLGELEHRLRDAALAGRVEVIFQRLPVPYVAREALPRRIRRDREKQFRVVAGYNLESALGLQSTAIPTDLFLVSSEGTLHTLRADRVVPELGYRYPGHRRVGFWGPRAGLILDGSRTADFRGTGEKKASWRPFARNKFRPFDLECLVDRESVDPYADLVSFTEWLESLVRSVQQELRSAVNSKLGEIRHRARRLDAADLPPSLKDHV